MRDWDDEDRALQAHRIELCNALMVAATRTAGSYDGVSGGPLVRQRASALMYEAATVRWGAWSSWRRGAAVNEWVERWAEAVWERLHNQAQAAAEARHGR